MHETRTHAGEQKDKARKQHMKNTAAFIGKNKIPCEFVEHVLAAMRKKAGKRGLEIVNKSEVLEKQLYKLGLTRDQFGPLSVPASKRLLNKFEGFMYKYRQENRCNIISGKQKELMENLGVKVPNHRMNTAQAKAIIDAA